MANTRHFWIDVEGEKAIMRSLVIGPAQIDKGVVEMIEDIGRRGETFMRLYAPAHSGELLRRIGRGPIHEVPSPTGTAIQQTIGVRAGDKHPFYVHFGTGIYKRTGPRLIEPLKPGGVLTFQKKGEPRRFKRWVTGQEPNPFVERAYNLLVPYARIRAAAHAGRIFRRMNS